MDNLFFDRKDLKSCGSNVIIGKTVRIRRPELVEIRDNVIIDDFTYISTALVINEFVHISSGCKLIGGPQATIRFDSFSTLAPNVVLAAGSDDYIGGIATPMVPSRFKGKIEIGDITLGRHCIVGANSTVLPGVRFAEGACLGAQSMAKVDLDAWSLYAGCPARLVKRRNKDQIEAFEKAFWEERRHGF